MILLLVGCGSDPVEYTFLEGFSYRWTRFNHRLSTLHVATGPDQAEVAVVGGTSTTGVGPDLADSCDASTCQEFPFIDTSDVVVRSATVSSDTHALRVADVDVTVEAGATPTTTDVVVPVFGNGTPIAILQGMELDTDHPLDIQSCYDPAFGWLPTRVAVTLGAPTKVSDGFSVPVTTAFEAGNTLETGRACVDSSRERAVVWIRLKVAVALTRGESQAIPLAFHGAWELGAEQPDPAAAERPLEPPFPDAIWGWSGVDFRFHVDDPSRRGAYLRSLAFLADPDAGLLSAHASNVSSPTQLSGFDYDFVGGVTAFTVPGVVPANLAAVGTLAAELDDAGDAVIHPIGYEP